MKRSFWVVFLVLILICVGAMVLQAEGPKVANDFKINSDAKHFGGKKKKGAPEYELVPLSHKKHADMYGCKVCHHELKSDDPAEKAKAKKCSSEGCHTAAAKDKCMNLENAMHDQCYKGCHKTDEKAKAAKAPTSCTNCHAKVK